MFQGHTLDDAHQPDRAGKDSRSPVFIRDVLGIRVQILVHNLAIPQFLDEGQRLHRDIIVDDGFGLVS